jgi:hypothetical protein
VGEDGWIQVVRKNKNVGVTNNQALKYLASKITVVVRPDTSLTTATNKPSFGSAQLGNGRHQDQSPPSLIYALGKENVNEASDSTKWLK